MNPPAAVQRPAAGPASPPRRAPRTSILFAVLALAGVLLITQLLAAPHEISRLTVENPTDYSLLIEVSDGHRHGWLPMATIDRHTTTNVEQLYDVGDTWRFRVWAQTADGGTFLLTRKQLEQADWHVQIPHRVGNALRAAGVEAQP